MVIKHKKDCLQLPEKRYRKIICKPTASVLRVAEAIVRRCPQCRHRHDFAAGIERRLPVPRAAGRRDEMHALHGWHCGGMGGPGRSRGHVSGHRHAGPRVEGSIGQADGPLPSVRRQAGSPQDGPHLAGSAMPEGRRLEDALGRERGGRPAGDFRRLHRFRGSHRQAVPQGEVGRGALRSGELPGLRAKSDSAEGALATRKSRWTTGPTWKATPRLPLWPIPSRAA